MSSPKVTMLLLSYNSCLTEWDPTPKNSVKPHIELTVEGEQTSTT